MRARRTEPLMRYIRIFSELSNQLRYASQKRVLVEVALIKLTRPSMEPNLDAILQRLGDLEMPDGGSGGRAHGHPMAAAQEAGSALPDTAWTGAGPGADGDSTRSRRMLRDFRQFGVHPKSGSSPGPAGGPEAGEKRMGQDSPQHGRRRQVYLRDTVVEPGGEGCLTIVFMDPMNYDMGKRPPL